MLPIEFYRKIARRVRLLAYDLIGLKRTGYVSLESGIFFEPRMDLSLDNGVWLDRNGTLRGTGKCRIGEYTYIGADFSIHCMSEITIGRECMFGDKVSVLDNDHGMDLATPMRTQPLRAKPITIGDDCWLGQGVTVLSGVTIGEGAVIAAGAVLRTDVPPRAIFAGVPARFIKMRE